MATVDPKNLKNNSINASLNAKKSTSLEQVKPKREKVVTGNVRTKKNGALKTLYSKFIGEELPRIKTHIIKDILEPTIKDAIANTLIDGVNMVLFGEAKRRGSSRSSIGRGSYHDYYDRRRGSGSGDSERVTSVKFKCEDLVFDTRRDAETVLKELFNALDEYHIATVFDLYEFAGKTPPYTAKKYGWTILDDADIKTIRDDQGIGYVIKLREPMLID